MLVKIGRVVDLSHKLCPGREEGRKLQMTIQLTKFTIEALVTIREI